LFKKDSQRRNVKIKYFFKTPQEEGLRKSRGGAGVSVLNRGRSTVGFFLFGLLLKEKGK